MPNIHSKRPSTFWEAVGAMLTTPLGCGGSEEADDSVFDDVPSAMPADVASDAVAATDVITATDADDASCYLLVPGESAGLKINEILYSPSDGDSEWVELFNKSDQSINIKNFTITNREAVPLATLPDWDIPACSYMVVHFGQGTDSNNFTNGAAHYFTNLAADAFDNSRDEVALYIKDPNAETIIDFVAYSGAEMVYEGHAFKHAVTAAIWKSGDFFSTTGSNEEAFSMPIIVSPGETIGRDRYSTDTNTSKDWAGMGGIDGLGETYGAENFTPITLQDPVKIKKQKLKKWTVAVYMGADNNLEPYSFVDLKKLEKVGSGKKLNIVVLADFAVKDFAPKIKGIQSAAKIYIKKDKNNAKGLVSDIEIIPEPDTGEAETLSDFLDWVQENFPAERYFLLSSGHGAGWKGFAFDWSNGHNRLTMGEMSEALSNAPKFDIVAFQNCLMGSIEVADQLKNSAKFLVASEEVVTVSDWGGWPWDLVVEKISTDPNIGADKLAKFTVQETEKKYAEHLDKLIKKGADPDMTTLLNARTMSAINLSSADFKSLIDEITAFSEELKNGVEDWGKVKTVHDEPKDNVQRRISNLLQGDSMVDSYPMRKTERPDNRDLYRFAQGIQKDALIDESWKSHAQKIMDLIHSPAVVVEKANGGLHKDAMGLSIYFPKAHTFFETGGVTTKDPSPFDTPLSGMKDIELYIADDDATAAEDHPLPAAKGFPFPINTGWGKFLNRFYNPAADPSCVRHKAPDEEKGESKCTAKIGQKVDLRAKGSSDSDGKLVKYYWDFDLAADKNNGDYDKDGNIQGDTDDDNDAEGIKTEYECKVKGEHKIRLMVWDDHNTKNDHSKHFQVDDEIVIINCQK